jgi:hypothetical protein
MQLEFNPAASTPKNYIRIGIGLVRKYQSLIKGGFWLDIEYIVE